MIEITPRAMVLLKDYFRNKKNKPVRIYVKTGGCGIRTFGISIEKPQRNDVVTPVNGFTFIINKELLEKVKPVKIDADSISFRISGNGIEPNSGCGACGLMCGLTGSKKCSGDCINCTNPCSNGERIRNARKHS
jgi:iron-sulfur cluster assembly protein